MNRPATEHSLLSNLVARLEIRMLALALVLGAALSILSPHFLTSNNLWNVLDQSVVVGIVAIGMTFVILIGGIDLSVGSVAGLTGVILGRGLELLAEEGVLEEEVLEGHRHRGDAEDDEGRNIALLSDALDPSAVRPGAVLVAGTPAFWSWTVVDAVEDGKIAARGIHATLGMA